MTAQKKFSELSRPEKLVRVRQEDIILTDEMRAELAALKYRKVDLTDPDNPEITDWSKAVRGKFYRPRKQQVTIRLDMHVLAWFKQAADQYQTLINEACKEYMMHHMKTKKRTRYGKKV